MAYGSILGQTAPGAYTKQQTLADQTKLAYGLSASATPNDIFNLIQPTFSNYPLKGNCEIVYHTYTGNGQNQVTRTFEHKILAYFENFVTAPGGQSVNLGIWGVKGTPFASANGEYYQYRVGFTWGDNSITISYSNSGYNESGRTYAYVALLAKDE